MKQLTITLPDSVQMSQQEVEALVLEWVTAHPATAPTSTADSGTRAGRTTSPEEAVEIRRLIGLYHAERATQLMGELWEQNDWTADTMQQWLREHMRTNHGRPQP